MMPDVRGGLSIAQRLHVRQQIEWVVVSLVYRDRIGKRDGLDS